MTPLGDPAAQGPVIPDFGKGSDCVVENRLFCPGGQTTDRASIPASDTPSCPVYRCEDIQFFDYR